MILEIDNYCISRNDEGFARLTVFEVSYSKLTKNYTSASGKAIIYGIKKCKEEITFTIECKEAEFNYILGFLNSGYIYLVKYNRFEDELYQENENGDLINKSNTIEKTMYISGNITTSKIYGGAGGLYTITGKFMEV